MQKTHLYRRLTRRFNDGWKMHDNHRFLTDMKLFPARVTSEQPEDSLSPGANYTVFVEVQDKSLHLKDVAQPLRDFFGRSCRCEHDCCGHASTYAGPITRVGRGRFSVQVRERYNV